MLDSGLSAWTFLLTLCKSTLGDISWPYTSHFICMLMIISFIFLSTLPQSLMLYDIWQWMFFKLVVIHSQFSTFPNIQYSSHEIMPSTSAKNIDVFLDKPFTFENHIFAICKGDSSFIIIILSQLSTETLVNALITSKVDITAILSCTVCQSIFLQACKMFLILLQD